MPSLHIKNLFTQYTLLMYIIFHIFLIYTINVLIVSYIFTHTHLCNLTLCFSLHTAKLHSSPLYKMNLWPSTAMHFIFSNSIAYNSLWLYNIILNYSVTHNTFILILCHFGWHYSKYTYLYLLTDGFIFTSRFLNERFLWAILILIATVWQFPFPRRILACFSFSGNGFYVLFSFLPVSKMYFWSLQWHFFG